MVGPDWFITGRGLFLDFSAKRGGDFDVIGPSFDKGSGNA
jgi:hypothetical protein